MQLETWSKFDLTQESSRNIKGTCDYIRSLFLMSKFQVLLGLEFHDDYCIPG